MLDAFFDAIAELVIKWMGTRKAKRRSGIQFRQRNIEEAWRSAQEIGSGVIDADDSIILIAAPENKVRVHERITGSQRDVTEAELAGYLERGLSAIPRPDNQPNKAQ